MLQFSPTERLLAGAVEPALDSSVFSPATPEAEHIVSLFWLVMAIAVVIFLAVQGFLIYAVLRF